MSSPSVYQSIEFGPSDSVPLSPSPSSVRQVSGHTHTDHRYGHVVGGRRKASSDHLLISAVDHGLSLLMSAGGGDGGPVSLPEVPRAGAGWLGNVTYIPTPSPTNCNLALNAWTGQSVRPRAGSWKTKKDLGPSISFVLDNTAAGADWTGCAATMFQADSGRPEWPASCRRRSPPSACCIKSAP